MNFMYSPLGKGIVHSSLWDEPPGVRVLFITMLALKDRDDVVRLDERNLYRAAKLPLEDFKEALKVLQEPDRRDPFEQAHDGRRIERCADGWKVLNGAKYQRLMVEANKRAREAAKKARQRALEKIKRVDGREAKYERDVEAGGDPDAAAADALTDPGVVDEYVRRVVNTEEGEEVEVEKL